MDRLVKLADDFWNIRGSFKIGGLFDIGAQSSLVRLTSGDFVLLDAYPISGEIARELLAATDGGRAIRAILNLHPFHTVHVRAVAAQFPEARLYGTRRHHAVAPELRWEPLFTEDTALHALFERDFKFTVPRGVDFIPKREQLHFASVLALHGSSSTLHVDDTLTSVDVPLVGGLRFHPTLRFVLQKRPGAAAEFRAWTDELIALCGDVRQLCPAHLRARPKSQRAPVDQVRAARDKISKLLDAHQRRYG